MSRTLSELPRDVLAGLSKKDKGKLFNLGGYVAKVDGEYHVGFDAADLAGQFPGAVIREIAGKTGTGRAAHHFHGSAEVPLRSPRGSGKRYGRFHPEDATEAKRRPRMGMEMLADHQEVLKVDFKGGEPVVIDTNVILSALSDRTWQNSCRRIWDIVRNGKLCPCFTPPILRELSRTVKAEIGNGHITGLNVIDAEAAVRVVMAKGFNVHRAIFESPNPFMQEIDPEDDEFIRALFGVRRLTENKKGVLVSRDGHVLSVGKEYKGFEGIIVHPEDFLRQRKR